MTFFGFARVALVEFDIGQCVMRLISPESLVILFWTGYTRGYSRWSEERERESDIREFEARGVINIFFGTECRRGPRVFCSLIGRKKLLPRIFNLPLLYIWT